MSVEKCSACFREVRNQRMYPGKLCLACHSGQNSDYKCLICGKAIKESFTCVSVYCCSHKCIGEKGRRDVMERAKAK